MPFDRPYARNYNAASDRFATTFAEISVGLRGLPTGQGLSPRRLGTGQKELVAVSAKSDDPAKGLIVRFDERSNVTWPVDAKTGKRHAQHRALPRLRKEVETCGLCHAPPRPILRELAAGSVVIGNTHAVFAD